MMTKRQRQRAYYLHYKLRKLNYRVNTRQKTVMVPSQQFEQGGYSPLVGRYLAELRQTYHYAIQSTI
jgi:hypothetical protein